MTSTSLTRDPETLNGYIYRQLRRIGLLDYPAIRFSQSIRINRYSSGDIIFERGAKVTEWTLVVSGLVAMNVSTSQYDSIPLVIYGIGSWFGEDAILNNELSQGTYQCLSDSVVMQMNEYAFKELHKSEVGFNSKMNYLIAKRYQRIAELHTLQKIGTPCMKVVMGIAYVSEALYTELETQQSIESITIPVSQTVLASLCGVSRTTLSEYILKLAKHKMIQTNYGKVQVMQVSKWKKLIARHQSSSIIVPVNDIDEFLKI
ncbi:Crp/Fnr family transcriptional regulator [Rhodoferax mekongensis]|uniref:Crp/Fnr family transcriptional regulator n=1 Tax=Rhodoferax mekongensis TaxID=3068341 RepID=UPI0028BD7E76|nr:Crp/Fnr family transcriptional regulator [Rhodoferax sp. TBRC 17199]MDT7517086.1 Crp/Fnr family transcriptional regulator [Rhodoferax sp. TBRC 17199]